MNAAILILVISTLFIAGTLMESKLLSNEGELVEFTQFQFYLIVSFSLVAISAVTLGISAIWVRYRAIIYMHIILLILPAVALLLVSMKLSEVTAASEAGL
jgi:hypothetical protein